MRGELQSVQRELQSVRDEAKAAAVGKERLTQEFQTKQAQVCSLEGQLDASRTLNNKLNHEVKRSVLSPGATSFNRVLSSHLKHKTFVIDEKWAAKYRYYKANVTVR